MPVKFFTKNSKNSRGDTIIEVILAIAAISLVLSVAYVSVGHSLQIGTDAGNRQRAVGLTQQQIERVKNILSNANNDPSQFSSQNGPFCVDKNYNIVPAQTSGTYKDYCVVCTNLSGVTDSNQEFADTSGNCPSGDRQLYAVQVKYSALIFTVNSQWSGASSLPSTATQYYKIPTIGVVGATGVGSGLGPTSCFFNGSTSSLTRDTNVPLPYKAKYTAKISFTPNCIPTSIIERPTSPGYPVIRYYANCTYTDGSNPYASPNSSGPFSPNYNIVWDGGEYATYVFYAKNSGDGCSTVQFDWKGWDTRNPTPTYASKSFSFIEP